MTSSETVAGNGESQRAESRPAGEGVPPGSTPGMPIGTGAEHPEDSGASRRQPAPAITGTTRLRQADTPDAR